MNDQRLEQQSKVEGAKYDKDADEYRIWCDNCNKWMPFEMYNQEDLINGGDNVIVYCVDCG